MDAFTELPKVLEQKMGKKVLLSFVKVVILLFRGTQGDWKAYPFADFQSEFVISC